MTKKILVAGLLGFAISSMYGCAATNGPVTDYTAFRHHMPRSVLVLPPLNQSPDIAAPYSFLSTVSRPLGERGYYVFPVAVVDALMKENGLPTPGEMHTVPLPRLVEVTGADSVLYVTIDDWGQKYQIIDSVTVVDAKARLVDTRSGITLWTGRCFAKQSSGGGNQGGLVGLLVNAAVGQIINDTTDRAHLLSRSASTSMVFNQRNGLLPGPRDPSYISNDPDSATGKRQPLGEHVDESKAVEQSVEQ